MLLNTKQSKLEKSTTTTTTTTNTNSNKQTSKSPILTKKHCMSTELLLKNSQTCTLPVGSLLDAHPVYCPIELDPSIAFIVFHTRTLLCRFIHEASYDTYDHTLEYSRIRIRDLRLRIQYLLFAIQAVSQICNCLTLGCDVVQLALLFQIFHKLYIVRRIVRSQAHNIPSVSNLLVLHQLKENVSAKGLNSRLRSTRV